MSCKHMHLSFKSVCNKDHKGVICNMTSSSYSSKSTRPTGRVLWEELLILFQISLVITRGRVDFLSPENDYPVMKKNYITTPVQNTQKHNGSNNKQKRGVRRVLDSRLRGYGFKPHRRHCVVSLSTTLYPLLSIGSTQEDSSRHN